MSNYALVLVGFSLMACSSQSPTLRVGDAQASRIDAGERERLAREGATAREELTRAEGEVAHAQEVVRVVAAERKRTQEPQLLRVLDAKSQWASTRSSWREIQVECARRHEYAAIAKGELDKAEIVSRNGADLDVERFRGQYGGAHAAWSKCNGKLAAAHAAADAAEGQLAAAKSQYAHDKLVAASAEPQPPTK